MDNKKHRKLLEKMYGNLYHINTKGERLLCAYCGDVREALDHVPPLHLVDLYGTEQLRNKDVPLELYPCCKSCNSILGARPLLTYEERLNFLYQYLLDKADNVVHWDKEELKEMSPNFQKQIIATQVSKQKELQRRILGIEQRMCQIEVE